MKERLSVCTCNNIHSIFSNSNENMYEMNTIIVRYYELFHCSELYINNDVKEYYKLNDK